MTPLLAVFCALAAAVGALVDGRQARSSRRRVAGLLALAPAAPARARGPVLPAPLRGRGVPCAVGLVAWVLIGGPVGLTVGVGAAWSLRYRQTRRPRDADAGSAEGAETARQLPLAADLLAACASAGAGPAESAEAVGRSLGGPVGERLMRTAAELRLGGEPAEVWRRFGAIPGAEGLARCLERAASSGAPAAEAVARHAEALRAGRARAAAARAQRAQVLITAPVGLCFLPAFLAVGVAPVVIGLASGLLAGT
ncbi:type II secretion system F family protein [Streptomyces sp. NPDC056069]|uniref:type II secretion system F family protein n=1 Tax=Streptomyces sp. NPDC056069 TaxID=3345702 RepID=UPI0035DAE3F2